jgi:hypothetical protein
MRATAKPLPSTYNGPDNSTPFDFFPAAFLKQRNLPLSPTKAIDH